jgi:hypothetical protein
MAVEGQPLIPTRGAAGRGAVGWEEQLQGGRGRVRLVAGAVGCVAVLALLGMETRGLMHFGTLELTALLRLCRPLCPFPLLPRTARYVRVAVPCVRAASCPCSRCVPTVQSTRSRLGSRRGAGCGRAR